MLKRLLRILLAGVVAPVLPKMVGTSIRPVQLVKIDVIGLQAPQAALDTVANLLRADIDAVLQVADAGTGDLAGDNHPLALAVSLQPAADDFLGAAGGLRAQRVRRVELRGIDEIDAVIERVIDLRMALGLTVLGSPGHRAEADFADVDVAAAESPVFHHESRG